MRPWLEASAIAAAIVMSAGLGARAASAATFVGPVKGSDAYVAIAKDGRKIGGYVCDDGTTSRWARIPLAPQGQRVARGRHHG